MIGNKIYRKLFFNIHELDNVQLKFYLRDLRKIIPIFLIIIILINHLNIIGVVMDFSARYKKENCKTAKNFPAEKESEPEKENKGKEKLEEPEKFYSRNNYIIAARFQLPSDDKFICFNTRLNPHPYHEDDIQPPQAV